MNARAFEARQRVLELGERYISYCDEGDGTPIVLVHGMPTWGWLWQDLAMHLAQRGFRVLVPDLLGFGYSDKSDRFDRSIEHQAEALDVWMRRLGIGSATWVGHDIGGGVALRMATFFPSRVERLCLMDSVCYDAWPQESMLGFGLPELRRKISAAEAVEKLRDTLRRGFATSPSDETLDHLLAPYETEVGKLSLIRDAAALDTNQTTALGPILPRLTTPTLILWGEEDRFLPARYGDRLAWDLPFASLVRLQDAGHFLLLDRPEEVERQLLSWL